jgi:hypothetical protein
MSIREVSIASLDAKAWRTIDFHEGDPVDEVSFKALIREPVELIKLKTAQKIAN